MFSIVARYNLQAPVLQKRARAPVALHWRPEKAVIACEELRAAAGVAKLPHTIVGEGCHL